MNETVAPLAAGRVLPGSVHDKRAEWTWGVLAGLEAAGRVVLAGKGYQGAAHAKIPYKGKNKPESERQANKAHAQLRAPGERPAQDPGASFASAALLPGPEGVSKRRAAASCR